MSDQTGQHQEHMGGSVAAGPPKGLVDRAKAIITDPKKEWPVIAAEQPDTGKILTGYVIPLALIPAVASFIGYAWIAGGFGMTWGFAYALISLLGTLTGVLVSAAVISALGGAFDSSKDFGKALQMVAYAYTPMWVAGILNIVPFLGFLVFIAGIYSIYIFYLGLPTVMNTPKDKVVVYMIVSAIVMIFATFVVLAIFSAIIFSIFGLGVGAFM